MLLLLCWFQLRHINHTSIIIATSILGGRQWHDILRIRWSLNSYLRSMLLWRCALWRAGWILTKLVHLRWVNDWIVQWRRHRYHRWWKLIAILVTFLDNKSPIIKSSVLWRAGWLLMNWVQLRWIDGWIIQWIRHRYYWWWQLIAIWLNFLSFGAPVIMRGRSFPILIFPCSTFCGYYQYLLDVAWLMQYEVVVVLCTCYFVCW